MEMCCDSEISGSKNYSGSPPTLLTRAFTALRAFFSRKAVKARLFFCQELGIFLAQPVFMQTNYYAPRMLALIRIITGMLFIYHGHEVFVPGQMTGYTKWMADLHYPMPALFAYMGKGAELLGGISLLLGLWVRVFTLPLTITLLLITFTMGHGKILTDDQHPFVSALLTAVFFCLGGGVWSADAWRKKQSA